jgi:hypothetical protein
MTSTHRKSSAELQTADRAVAMIGGGQMALALAEGFCRAGLLAAAVDPVTAAARMAAIAAQLHVWGMGTEYTCGVRWRRRRTA